MLHLQQRQRNADMILMIQVPSRFHAFSRKYKEKEICLSFTGQDLRDQVSDRYLNTSSKTNTLTMLQELVRLEKNKTKQKKTSVVIISLFPLY